MKHMASEVKIGRESMDAVQRNELDRDVLTWAQLLSDDGTLPEHEMGGDATGFVPRVDQVEEFFGDERCREVGYSGKPVLHNALGLTGVGRRNPDVITREQLEEVARVVRETGSFRACESLKLTGVGAVDPDLITDDVAKDVEWAISDRQISEPHQDVLVRMYEEKFGKPEKKYLELDGDLDSTSCSPDGELFRRTGKILPERGLSQRQLMKASRGKKDKSKISSDKYRAKRGELVRGRSARGNRRMDRVEAKDLMTARNAKEALREGVLATRLGVAEVSGFEGGFVDVPSKARLNVVPGEEKSWEELFDTYKYREGLNCAHEPVNYFDELLAEDEDGEDDFIYSGAHSSLNTQPIRRRRNSHKPTPRAPLE